MARFKDTLPSQQGWIHELARSEMNSEAEKILQLGHSFDPQQLVEESTVDFLMELRENFTEFARILNGYSESSVRFQEIKVYSVAQTPSDFMIFRNQMKLVIANTAHGVIQIGFAQHVRGGLAIDGQNMSPTQTAIPGSQELLAQVGPFRDITWTFQGENVSAEQVAKFYFAEFTRVSRDLKRSKLSHEMLLEQIKTFLQDKGLNP